MQPLITVYITNFNYCQYIRQAIESVLSQTCKDFELLIIDDGSTDNSREIIEEYREHPKIKIIYQKNRGLNYSNNIAMRTATGKYLMRLDADDFLDSSALKEMSERLEEDNEIGLVFPDYYYVDSEGVITGEVRRHDFRTEVSLFDQAAHGACTMIRLDYLRNLGGYNESFTCQDGYDLWIKFITHHKVANINKPLFFYRRHGSNLSENEDKILSTRKKINDSFINSFSTTVQKTSVIIPIRKTMINTTNWPLYKKCNGSTVLEEMVKKAAASKKIDTVVVTSEDQEILNFTHQLKDQVDKLLVIPRPPEYARVNESLNKTIFLVLNELKNKGIEPDLIMTLGIENPFISTDILEDAINTQTIFNSDSLISVRPDNRTYYQHNGQGMHPILDQERFTKFERDALYKGSGGIVLTKKENFMKFRKMQSGKVGHIIVGNWTAFGVFSEFDLEVFKLIDQKFVVSL